MLGILLQQVPQVGSEESRVMSSPRTGIIFGAIMHGSTVKGDPVFPVTMPSKRRHCEQIRGCSPRVAPVTHICQVGRTTHAIEKRWWSETMPPPPYKQRFGSPKAFGSQQWATSTPTLNKLWGLVSFRCKPRASTASWPMKRIHKG